MYTGCIVSGRMCVCVCVDVRVCGGVEGVGVGVDVHMKEAWQGDAGQSDTATTGDRGRRACQRAGP